MPVLSPGLLRGVSVSRYLLHPRENLPFVALADLIQPQISLCFIKIWIPFQSYFVHGFRKKFAFFFYFQIVPISVLEVG